MASSKNSNEHQKSNWDDLAIEDSASDLEDSWAGEEVMFDGSPSSGNFEIVVSFGWIFQNYFYISKLKPNQLLFRQNYDRVLFGILALICKIPTASEFRRKRYYYVLYLDPLILH